MARDLYLHSCLIIGYTCFFMDIPDLYFVFVDSFKVDNKGSDFASNWKTIARIFTQKLILSNSEK